MAQVRPNRFWIIAVLLLVTVIITSSFIAWTNYRPSKPVEIILPPEQEMRGNIFIDGAVANPGIYPYSGGDSIGSILQSAGGVTVDSKPDSLTLTIPQTNTADTSQKIDVNHADAWLLEALQGIGTTRAKAIIDYRQKNGLFRNINELTKVDGISPALLEQIRPLLTISD